MLAPLPISLTSQRGLLRLTNDAPLGRAIGTGGESGGVAPGGFAPTDIAGLQFWVSDTGASAATWPDLSGSSRDATQATGANQPSIASGAINGKQARLFDGSNDFLSVPTLGSFGPTSPVTVSVVVQLNSLAANAEIFSQVSADGHYDFGIFYNSANGKFGVFGEDPAVGSDVVYTASSVTVDTTYIITVVFDGNTEISIYLNGVFQNAGPITVSTSASTSGFFIGKLRQNGSDFYPFSGYEAELTAYNSAIGDVNRAALEGYLTTKYAVQSGPANLTLSQPTSTGDLKADWDAVGGASGYEYSVDGGGWTSNSTATTATISAPGLGAHTFEVRALGGPSSVASLTIAQQLPVNVSPPSLSSNGDLSSPNNGDILTCDPGVWTAWPSISSYSYIWYACQNPDGSVALDPSSGRFSASYMIESSGAPDATRYMTCRVIATNALGTSGADSNVSGLVNFP